MIPARVQLLSLARTLLIHPVVGGSLSRRFAREIRVDADNPERRITGFLDEPSSPQLRQRGGRVGMVGAAVRIDDAHDAVSQVGT
ncbi:hypothetical protein M3672_07955 [Microbacterium enclense]|uniref:hypothetical protein n=1 Tax=Microbacterium enclense TaxID=993073 RepID=UPI00203DA6D0|nr:hypothetical protein [Microbacterium enclense]MCM3614373.1 hypothetical protein [Microbacterium enclense]